MSAFNEQVGGDHYKCLAASPFKFIQTNNFSFFIGNVIKYASRYATLGEPEDIEKIIGYCMLELEHKHSRSEAPEPPEADINFDPFNIKKVKPNAEPIETEGVQV
jgi:hypothetical protein